MEIDKGDLVLISNGEKHSTCIVLTDTYAIGSELGHNFYYSYCVETGLYGILYESDILTVLQKDFAPDFPMDSDLFNVKMPWFEEYFYFPSFYPYDDDSTDESDGED